MRIFWILGILWSWNVLACNLLIQNGESIRFNEDGSKIERTMAKAKEKGWTYVSKEEWATYKKYSEEIFKDEYSKMSDDQMTKLIASKWKTRPETLKQIYIKGNAVEQNCSKLK